MTPMGSRGNAFLGGAIGATETGRYKVDGSGNCYWDPEDTGPDQCSPGGGGQPGRYKVDGTGHCYWEPNDSGPAQCTPEPRAVDPSELEPTNENTTPEAEFANGLGFLGSLPSCNYLKVNGNVGWIEITTNPSNGYIWYAMGMHSPIENWGWWFVQEIVNFTPLNSKTEYYPPHGSQPPSNVPSGAVYRLEVKHLYMRLSWIWVWDPWHPDANGAGFRPHLIQSPALAWGSATCLKA